MKMSQEVLNALEILKNAAENDFERHRIAVLEKDLQEPPKIEVIDENHQRFNGISFRKRKDGHYGTPMLFIYRAVYMYYYGEIPKGTIIHHIDNNKSNNNIDNLKIMTPAAHRHLHGGNGRTPNTKQVVNKTEYVKKCAWCGKEFKTFVKKTKCCSSQCGQRLFYFKKTGKKTPYIKKCPICGKEFTVTREYHTKKTCSPECAKKANLIRKPRKLLPKKIITKICPVCGKTFYLTSKHKNTKTCSRKCGQQLWRKK